MQAVIPYNAGFDVAEHRKDIYDADGDGVEDNQWYHPDVLEKFYKPAVFNPLEDMYNTHHGNLPGHIQK